MRKPRILINTDRSTSKFNTFIKSDSLNIDTRSFVSINIGVTASVLKEYDLIVLDLLNELDIHEKRNQQLREYLLQGKTIICLLNEYKEKRGGVVNLGPIKSLLYDSFNNSNLKIIFNIESHGDTYDITNYGRHHIFNKYLDSEKKQWRIALNKKLSPDVNILAQNVNVEPVAFTLKKYGGRVILLPYLPSNEEIFWDTVEEISFTVGNISEPVEEWVSKYTVPTLDVKIRKIKQIQERIDKYEVEKKEYENEKKHLENIRNTLLYRDGKILQDTVKEVLIELGIEAEDGPDGREDITFIYGDKHFVIEVKGLTKSAGEKHMSQLNSKKVQYEEDNKVKAKGVLLVNAWRKVPLEKRGTNDKPIFPDQMMELANIWEIALMTTQQLFVMYCKNLEGNFDVDSFIENVYKTIGVYNEYAVYTEYKIK